MSKPHETGSPHLREELTRLVGSYPLLKEMLDENLPQTREMYIAMNWGADVPKPWTGQDEDQIPEPLRNIREA